MLMPLNSSGVIKTAFDRAPQFLLCCDDYSHGVYRQAKTNALLKRHVQIDKRGCCSVILIDIDRRGAASAYDDVGLPPPSWSCTNPRNGHAHIAYVLEQPVWRIDHLADSPVRLLHAIRQALTTMLSGDPNFAARLTKNPLHPDWVVDTVNKTYSLSELWEYIPRRFFQLQPQGPCEDFGAETTASRNKTVFDAVRLKHYPEWSKLVLLPKHVVLETLMRSARQFNVFAIPLPERELVTICRSIERFIRIQYRAPEDAAVFKRRQANRQRLAALKRRQNNHQRLRTAAITLANSGAPLTFSSIARQAGMTRQTAASTHRDLCRQLMLTLSRPGNTSQPEKTRKINEL